MIHTEKTWPKSLTKDQALAIAKRNLDKRGKITGRYAGAVCRVLGVVDITLGVGTSSWRVVIGHDVITADEVSYKWDGYEVELLVPKGQFKTRWAGFLFDHFREAPWVDINFDLDGPNKKGRYPHTCPRCKGAVYMGCVPAAYEHEKTGNASCPA